IITITKQTTLDRIITGTIRSPAQDGPPRDPMLETPERQTIEIKKEVSSNYSPTKQAIDQGRLVNVTRRRSIRKT
ncbi:hypothetical protein ACJ73_10318, partial [Blastomyces percursus]